MEFVSHGVILMEFTFLMNLLFSDGLLINFLLEQDNWISCMD